MLLRRSSAFGDSLFGTRSRNFDARGYSLLPDLREDFLVTVSLESEFRFTRNRSRLHGCTFEYYRRLAVLAAQLEDCWVGLINPGDTVFAGWQCGVVYRKGEFNGCQYG